MATCKKCGQVIKWASMPDGQKIPCTPSAANNFITDDGEHVTANFIHWATCAASDKLECLRGTEGLINSGVSDKQNALMDILFHSENVDMVKNLINELCSTVADN
jgi:hypothetical protein